MAGDRIISTVDPDARHTRKSPEARRDGYRAHLAADPETGIITDEKLTKAAGEENSDPAVAGEFLAWAGHGNPGHAAVQGSSATAHGAGGGLAGQPGPDTASHDSRSGREAGGDCGKEPLAWYGDSAYGTGDLRGAIADAGHRR